MPTENEFEIGCEVVSFRVSDPAGRSDEHQRPARANGLRCFASTLLEVDPRLNYDVDVLLQYVRHAVGIGKKSAK